MIEAVSPELVGRERELATLQQWLGANSVKAARLLLVTGDAGVGKSRLLEEALALPEALAYGFIRANSLEGDEAEPYGLARVIIAAAGDARDVEAAFRPAPEAERQVQQVALALNTLLAGTREERPLLVIEDIHWCDEPSLQVLLALALRQDAPRFLLSYRPAPLSPTLAGFLGEVSRLRLGETINLEPLSPSDTGRMVRAMLHLQDALPAGLLHSITTATGGYPFLVEELLNTLAGKGILRQVDGAWQFRPDGTTAVPRSLRHAMEGRLLPLPAEVTRVAEAAAVLGQTVDTDGLRLLTNLEEEALFAALRALIAAQILVETPDGTIAFRHALTREAIRTRLLAPQRRALHRRVAQMLEKRGQGSPAVLAYHWSKAGEDSRAASYALQAGEKAAALHAHREAIRHYEMALRGGAGTSETILSALGEQYGALDEREAAVAHYAEAQAILRIQGDETAAALLDLRIGTVFAQQRMRAEALQSLQMAFHNLPQAHAERWRAGLHLGLQQAAMGQHDAAQATFAQALGAAGKDKLARLRVRYELSGLQARRGEWAALEQEAGHVLRETREVGDQSLALRYDAHAALGSMAYYRGQFTQAVDHFAACLHIAQTRGLLNEQLLARWNLATNALYHLGHWTAARQELATLQAQSPSGLAQPALVFEMWMDGAWEAAAEIWLSIWEEVQEGDDLEQQMAFGRRIADLLLALKRPAEALALVTPLLERFHRFKARSFVLQLLPRQVEALARLEEEAALPAAVEGLALARQLGGRPAEGLLLRGQAMALGNDGEWAASFATFESAMALLASLPMPYELARTLREAGLARLARGRRGDRERGAALFKRARQIFAELGAGRDEQASQAILSAAGLADERDSSSGPLTAREQEVAQLVTEGLSNAEIAQRLYITEKTAAHHVGSILQKLDFTSRVQIAVYITQQQ